MRNLPINQVRIIGIDYIALCMLVKRRVWGSVERLQAHLTDDVGLVQDGSLDLDRTRRQATTVGNDTRIL